MNGTETLSTLQRHDEAAALAPSSGGGIEIAASRAAQEVQAAMVVAKKFPRDERIAQARIEKACTRPTLAAISQYHYPRGGQEISGISIRLAEVMAQAWGNLDTGVVELEQRDDESLMMAYCWDLETNTRSTKMFTVPHYREKKGRNGMEKIALEGTRDVYEMTANMGARRLRACILSIIPRDVQDTAVEICNQTLAADFTEEKKLRMIAAYESDFSVTQEQLETFIGKRADKFDGGTYVRLRRVYSTLKDGFAAVQDFFPPPAQTSGKERSKFGFKKGKKDKIEPAKEGGESAPGMTEEQDPLWRCCDCGHQFRLSEAQTKKAGKETLVICPNQDPQCESVQTEPLPADETPAQFACQRCGEVYEAMPQDGKCHCLGIVAAVPGEPS